jgi:hypothetical protein
MNSERTAVIAHSSGLLQKLRQLGKIESRAFGVGCLLGRIADNTLLTTVKNGLIPAQPRRSFPRDGRYALKEGVL